MEHLSNDPKECPNYHQISGNIYDETKHLALSYTDIGDIRDNLRHQNDLNFKLEGESLQNKY